MGLRYVSYALLATAAVGYVLMRWRRGSATPGRMAAYAGCLALACVAWWAQERGMERSARRLMVGRVSAVEAYAGRSGVVDDRFEVRVGGGTRTMRFSADGVSESAAEQPLAAGDVVGVLYRVGDGAVVTIDELEGKHAGWHYRQEDPGGRRVYLAAGVGALGLVILLLDGNGRNGWRRRDGRRRDG